MTTRKARVSRPVDGLVRKCGYKWDNGMNASSHHICGCDAGHSGPHICRYGDCTAVSANAGGHAQ
jgi:hypothetical protein